MSNLYIPKKCKAGFNERKDTYSGKLAFVVGFDEKKSLWRQESSWKNWIKEDVEPVEFINSPTSGFVLNKSVGGSGWGHYSRQNLARVYDPRGWEFEISMENLLFILSEVDCSRGKGLEGEFVYSWSGARLTLLPVVSSSYKDSFKPKAKLPRVSNWDKLQVGDIVHGSNYDVDYIYLGKVRHFNYYNFMYRGFGFAERSKYFLNIDNIKQFNSNNLGVANEEHVFATQSRFDKDKYVFYNYPPKSPFLDSRKYEKIEELTEEHRHHLSLAKDGHKICDGEKFLCLIGTKRQLVSYKPIVGGIHVLKLADDFVDYFGSIVIKNGDEFYLSRTQSIYGRSSLETKGLGVFRIVNGEIAEETKLDISDEMEFFETELKFEKYGE